MKNSTLEQVACKKKRYLSPDGRELSVEKKDGVFCTMYRKSNGTLLRYLNRNLPVSTSFEEVQNALNCFAVTFSLKEIVS